MLPEAQCVANEPKPKTQNLTSSSRQTASPVRSRQVYTIGSPQFRFRFPELAPPTGIPNAHKRGLFRKLSSFIAGKEQPRPSGKPDSLEDLQTITYCDTDVLGEGAVRQLPLHFPHKVAVQHFFISFRGFGEGASILRSLLHFQHFPRSLRNAATCHSHRQCVVRSLTRCRRRIDQFFPFVHQPLSLSFPHHGWRILSSPVRRCCPSETQRHGRGRQNFKETEVRLRARPPSLPVGTIHHTMPAIWVASGASATHLLLLLRLILSHGVFLSVTANTSRMCTAWRRRKHLC